MFSSLRRHPESNVLFAGCFGWLAILLWAGNDFHLIQKIKNIVPSPISDIDVKINRKSVYTVCDHTQGMAIYFDKSFIHKRDHRKNPTPQTPMMQDFQTRGTYSSTREPPINQPHNRFNTKNLVIESRPQSIDNRNIVTVHEVPFNPMKASISEMYKLRPKSHAKHDFMYRNFKIKQIETPGVTMRRIAISKDLSKIYTSGLRFQMLENINGKFIKNEKANKLPDDVIDIKLLDSGCLLICEETNSDIVLYD